MAKQVGPVYYEGTMGDIVFYKVGNQYFSRFKGTYKSRKQMQRLPRYKRTLQLAEEFGKGAKIAGRVYVRYLPQPLRKRGVFGQFTGKATRLLREGKKEKEIQGLLIAYCEQLKAEAEAAKEAPPVAATPLNPVEETAKPKRKKEKVTVKQARYLPVPLPQTAIAGIPDPPLPLAHCLSPIDNPLTPQLAAP